MGELGKIMKSKDVSVEIKTKIIHIPMLPISMYGEWSHHDGISALTRRRRVKSSRSGHVRTEWRHPSVNQEDWSPQGPYLLEPWCWTSQPPKLWEITVCCIIPPVHNSMRSDNKRGSNKDYRGSLALTFCLNVNSGSLRGGGAAVRVHGFAAGFKEWTTQPVA